MSETAQAIRLTRDYWSQVLAFAWLNSEVLKDLRKDPKETITELAKEKSSKYQDVDNDTKAAADAIKKLAEEDPGESYRGYLPLPDNPFGDDLLNNLNQQDLARLLRNGIDGINKFEDKADLWAEELLAAWKDRDQLIAIRQDPLSNLKQAKELQDSTYGVLPLPDKPKGLCKLEIEDLVEFLGDQDNMYNLGGIFLFGS